VPLLAAILSAAAPGQVPDLDIGRDVVCDGLAAAPPAVVTPVAARMAQQVMRDNFCYAAVMHMLYIFGE